MQKVALALRITLA